MAHSDIANISLPVHDAKTGTAGFVSNKDFALVLQGFFTPKDDMILEEKGFAEPSIKEQALWSAYGLFNELDVLVSDPLSMDFPGKNTGVGGLFLLQGGLPNPGVESASPAGGFFTPEPPGKSIY